MATALFLCLCEKFLVKAFCVVVGHAADVIGDHQDTQIEEVGGGTGCQPFRFGMVHGFVEIGDRVDDAALDESHGCIGVVLDGCRHELGEQGIDDAAAVKFGLGFDGTGVDPFFAEVGDGADHMAGACVVEQVALESAVHDLFIVAQERVTCIMDHAGLEILIPLLNGGKFRLRALFRNFVPVDGFQFFHPFGETGFHGGIGECIMILFQGIEDLCDAKDFLYHGIFHIGGAVGNVIGRLQKVGERMAVAIHAGILIDGVEKFPLGIVVANLFIMKRIVVCKTVG